MNISPPKSRLVETQPFRVTVSPLLSIVSSPQLCVRNQLINYRFYKKLELCFEALKIKNIRTIRLEDIYGNFDCYYNYQYVCLAVSCRCDLDSSVGPLSLLSLYE